jgi:hypothetical protein
MKRKDKGRISGPFVALLKDTMASPAWRATSHGARSLYVALKARYSSTLHNNGRLFISQRTAVREIGSGFSQIARWFRELQFYGFIVQTKGGCLGVEGKGKAPHWRLTECGYMNDPPTRDFMRWNGVKFEDAGCRRKKQNPAPESWSTPLQKAGAPMLQKAGAPSRTSAPESWSIDDPATAPESWNISS